ARTAAGDASGLLSGRSGAYSATAPEDLAQRDGTRARIRSSGAGLIARSSTGRSSADAITPPNVAPVATGHPAGGKHDGVLATVKVWPVYAGARGKEGATANLDGVCARRHRAAMPERTSAHCRGIASLDRKCAAPRSGTILNEAIRLLTLIVAAHESAPP